LNLEVEVANWDHDAEPDGLRVLVAPLDYFGYVVPVFASVDFQLLTQPHRPPGAQHVRRRRSNQRREEWSRRVRIHDFGPAGAVYELPFRNLSANARFNIGPEALLTARLGVAGSGVFSANREFTLP
jgi:hypothetical protein